MNTRVGRRVDKPWGHEEVWAEGPGYVGKLLIVHAGHRLSLQHHALKVETIRVLSGEVEVSLGDHPDQLETERATAGAVIHIPAGRLHRLRAITDLELVEVSTPELDDVVRHADDYGRSSGSA